MSWVLYSPDPKHLPMLSHRCILEYENKTCKAMVGDKGARPRFPPSKPTRNITITLPTEHPWPITDRILALTPTCCSLKLRGLACGLKLRPTQATNTTWLALTHLQTHGPLSFDGSGSPKPVLVLIAGCEYIHVQTMRNLTWEMS